MNKTRDRDYILFITGSFTFKSESVHSYVDIAVSKLATGIITTGALLFSRMKKRSHWHRYYELLNITSTTQTNLNLHAI